MRILENYNHDFSPLGIKGPKSIRSGGLRHSFHFYPIAISLKFLTPAFLRVRYNCIACIVTSSSKTPGLSYVGTDVL